MTSTEVGYRKPHQGGCLELAGKLGVMPEERLFIGDEEMDVVGATAIGMTSVLINRTGTELRYRQSYRVKSLTVLLGLVQP